MRRQGKFIVIYGVNGTGKSTQVKEILKYFENEGIEIEYLKYPIYDLDPEGPFIDKYLREERFRKENFQTTEQLQEKYMLNRKRFQPKLEKILQSGKWVLAEDYIGTGIAWGLSWGADLEYLEDINKDLLKPDLEILLHGERFLSAVEKTHRNESNEEKIKIAKEKHLFLAQRYDWKIINCNQDIEKVSGDIQKEIKKIQNED